PLVGGGGGLGVHLGDEDVARCVGRDRRGPRGGRRGRPVAQGVAVVDRLDVVHEPDGRHGVGGRPGGLPGARGRQERGGGRRRGDGSARKHATFDGPPPPAGP